MTTNYFVSPDSYWDVYNLLHPKKGEMSENGILYTAQYYLARYLKDTSNKPEIAAYSALIHTARKDKFLDRPENLNKDVIHFSHDNMTGLYSLQYLYNGDCSHLPIMWWNCVKAHKLTKFHHYLQRRRGDDKYPWIHPRDIIYYSILKYGGSLWILPFILPIFCSYLVGFFLASLWVSLSKPEGETSGKCLWWLRLNTLSIHKNVLIRSLAKLTLKLVRIKWAKSFAVYFPDKDYPIHKELV